MRAWGLIALLAVGCSGGEGARVVLASGPIAQVAEGERTSIPVSIEPTPEQVVDASAFVVEVDGSAASSFAELDVITGPGGPELVIRPLCSMIRPGEGDAVVTIRVVAVPPDLADPADLEIRVSESEKQCAPVVDAYMVQAAPCDPADPSAVRGQPFEVSETSVVCLRVFSLDPEEELLYLRTSSDAPDTLLTPPSADAFVDETFEIPLGSVADIRGEFDIRHLVFVGDPTGGAMPDTDGTTLLRLGAPGEISIEPLRVDIDATEFDVGAMTFRVWWYPTSEQQDMRCVSAYRSTADTIDAVVRDKPFLRIIDAVGASVVDGEWLCSDQESFTLRVSPPIEALAVEDVVITAAGCSSTGCADDSTGASIATRDIAVNVTSVGEELACGSLEGPTRPLVACADIYGDSTPEVFMLTTGNKACAFLGSEHRYDGPLPSTGLAMAFAPEPVDQPPSEQLEPPITVLAMEWYDATIGGATNAILGRFASDPRIRRLSIEDDTPNALLVKWNPAPEMLFADGDDLPLERAQPISADASLGATHLAYIEQSPAVPTDWSLVIRCISNAIPNNVTPCQDTTFAFGPVTSDLVGFTAADIDGDGDRDLVYFLSDDLGSIDLVTVFFVELTWPTKEQAVIGRIASVSGIPLVGDEVVATPAPSSTAAEDVYVVFDPDLPIASLLQLKGKADAFTNPPTADASDYIATPGPALGVVGSSGGIVVSLVLGTWELTRSGADIVWRLADPVLQEAADAGNLIAPPAGYGRSLARCLSAPEAIIFTSEQRTARYTHRDVAVVDP